MLIEKLYLVQLLSVNRWKVDRKIMDSRYKEKIEQLENEVKKQEEIELNNQSLLTF